MYRTELVEAVVALAQQAGEAILGIYGEDDAGIEYKEDDSPLTRADLASHRILVDGLTALDPKVPVLSEEAVETHGDVRLGWDPFWLVDPLDGTKEFISRNGEFTVNVALIEAGEPVLGIVFAPILDRTYVGVVGEGAWRRDGSQRESSSHSLTAEAAATPPLKIVASRSHPSPDLQALLARLPQHELVAIGSSLKICLVAEGSADLYPRLGPTSEWDVGAGHAVLRAAGGEIVDLQGRPLRYNKENILNPHFVAEGRRRVPWREAVGSRTVEQL